MERYSYKDIFEKSTDGMLIIINDKFIDCNNSVVKMLHYDNKQQLLNTHPAELSPQYQPDGRKSYDKVEENTKYVIKNGSKTFEWVHLRSNGEAFWVEVVLTNISTDKDIIFLTVWREIEEKKRLEEKNTYQQMILSSVVNSSVDLIFYKDYRTDDGKYIGCNDSFGKFVGKTKEQIIGKNDIELFGEELGHFFRAKDKDVIDNQVDISNEEWVTYPSGEEVLLHTNKSLLKDFEGNVIGILGISRNMTAEYNYKVSLKEQEQQLVKQSRMAQMGEMISMIAHQWRQPLNTLGLITQKLGLYNSRGVLDDEKVQKIIHKSMNLINGMSTTIDDFRNFYKPTKESVSIKLEKIISRSLNIIKSTLLNDNIEIVQEYNSKKEIEIYENEMMQVILNLLKNAQDNFQEKDIKNPKITIRIEDRKISICDNGGGIPEDIMEKIFDPYFSTKDKDNGTGLGLYMSKTIVEEHHNGKLTVENRDKGACFIIELGIPSKK